MLLAKLIPISVILVGNWFAAAEARVKFPEQVQTSCGHVMLKQCWCLDEVSCESDDASLTEEYIPIVKNSRRILTKKDIQDYLQYYPPTELNLSIRLYESIDRTAFDNFTNVTSLNLAQNRLVKLPSFIFSKLKNLEYLSLAQNGLRGTKNVFVGLSKLKTLDISDNPLTEVLDDNYFAGLTKSCEILLKGVKGIKKISANAFGNESSAFVQDSTAKVINDEEPSSESIHTTFAPADRSHALDEPISNLDTDGIDHVSIAPPEDLTAKIISDEEPRSKSIHARSAPLDLPHAWNEPISNRYFRAQVCLQENIVQQVDVLEINADPSHGCQEVELRFKTLYFKSMGISEFEKGWYRLRRNKVPYSLSSLEISGNPLVRVTSNVVNDLPAYITWLNMEGNKIERLETRTFVHSRIFSLELQDNLIGEIEDNTFDMPNLYQLFLQRNRLRDTKFAATLPSSLTSLYLEHNEITEISADSFSNLKNLRYLNLDFNRIVTLQGQCFSGATSLNQLILSFNNITTIEPGAFDNINGFQIHLGNNNISALQKGIFTRRLRLWRLTINDNQLTKIEKEIFDLPSLESFDLKNNHITVIEKGAMKSLRKLEELDISKNPIDKLENGALFGLQKTGQVYVLVKDTPIRVIQGGLFDDV